MSGLELTTPMHEILLALRGGDRHGYAIMQLINGTPGRHGEIGPGTLYRSLDRLLEARLIRPLKGGESQRRIVYRITATGLRVANQRIEYLRGILSMAGEPT